MDALLLGVVFGLTITVSFGPGFIALFQTSITRGQLAGFVVATGILMSDLLLVSVSYFGLSGLVQQKYYRIMGILAGVILVVTGVVSFFRETEIVIRPENSQGLKESIPGLLMKGFLLNVANPLSLVFWIGIVAFAAKSWGISSYNVLWFFTGVFITAYSTDLLKCYLSGTLRKILASETIRFLTRAIAFIFIGIGIYIIYKVQ